MLCGENQLQQITRDRYLNTAFPRFSLPSDSHALIVLIRGRKRSGKFVIYLGKLGFTCSGDQGRASQVALVVKNLPANAGGIRDVCLIPGLARSPGGGHGNPLQYSCLENPRNGEAWWAASYRVAESDTTEAT